MEHLIQLSLVLGYLIKLIDFIKNHLSLKSFEIITELNIEPQKLLNLEQKKFKMYSPKI